ncbi:hypothetical protein VitviT2T_028456 [Vitis vinifera]|uniref:Histone-lysine N-methyltransferase ASHH1 n=1 Tax=Vitis vinifera TaxID=29760 RepID=A0ABY9DTC4_VITVI|nr:histone-lysine N-methyltransferase ASHH1 isoform X2 [Vitis vinifera]WKA10910.1 hypothetical protein VitviT2T_028456 [Vitis vinifera]|eukprot:XP_003634539.1 PREDICTED: histone-lysine N-methyltransferase ASHH1-like isoform X2 [Vitis vinifera]
MSQSQAPAVRRTHSRQHVASSACRIDPHGRFDQQIEGVRVYIHINKNDFSYREHIKQEEDDITICECKYNTNDPDSACGERCLNVLTSIECTPHYCPCSVHCKNQRFQKHEYAKTKLFRTEGRGWGLLANEDIKAGRFIIEYCGEVISWNEARERSLAYASQGINDAYIISLNARECIDATKSGSQARFINHSCEPNCETRKWSVLGEVRIGIFAMRDISIGTELTYDYNFQWYGGAKVHCLCGATSCCGFLGAKSRGFQDTDVWEDIDERCSLEDKPSLSMRPESMPKKRSKNNHNGPSRPLNREQVDAKFVAQFLASKEAQEEILKYEEQREEASSHLHLLYKDEVEPSIKENEIYGIDGVPASVAEKWIRASCMKLKAEFNLHSSIIRNIACTPQRAPDEAQPSEGEPKP